MLAYLPSTYALEQFLYEPFPVESSLADVLHNHLNAEIVSGTITSRSDAVDYLTWTYLFRRILVNPTYYGLESSDLPTVNRFLSQLVDDTLRDLADSQCIELDDEDKSSIYPLTMGQIISYYYLHHRTARLFFTSLGEDTTLPQLLQVLTMATEYAELPVRHNEDGLNEELAGDEGIRWELQSRDWEDPGVKANLLLQAHFARLGAFVLHLLTHLSFPLMPVPPISDYVTDQKSVLDQAIRILQAMVDVSADGGWLHTALRCMHLTQMVVQGQWVDQSSFFQLPHFDSRDQHAVMVRHGFQCLPQLLSAPEAKRNAALSEAFKGRKDRVSAALTACARFPVVDLQCTRVTANQVEARVRRTSKGSSSQAYCPLFPKQKREGWWLVVGSADGELLALKRITVAHQQTIKLELSAGGGDGSGGDSDEELYGSAANKKQEPAELWAYLMSDSYIGLDIQVQVAEQPAAAK